MRFELWTAHGRALAGAVSLVSALTAAVACGGDLPRPAYVGQTTEALEPVPYPPPPARVESVPPKPASGTVWLDGEWTWQGRLFGWRRGRWVKPPAGARYAPWTTVRGEDGTVYFAPGAWRDARNQPITDPPAIAVAGSAAATVIDDEGHDELTGHTVRESQGAGSASQNGDGGAGTAQTPPSSDEAAHADAGSSGN